MESIVKNCGGAAHKEVAQKDVVDAFRELAKVREFIFQMKNISSIYFYF